MTHAVWSKKVKELGGNKCAYCGATQKLEAHHIKPQSEYPELSVSLDNGITLCHDCHYSAHGGQYYNRVKCGHYRPFTVNPEEMRNFIKAYADEAMEKEKEG